MRTWVWSASLALWSFVFLVFTVYALTREACLVSDPPICTRAFGLSPLDFALIWLGGAVPLSVCWLLARRRR